MAFTRIRTINGKQYRYLEERYRQGGKVRSRSTYLGRFLASLAPVPPGEQGWRYIERQMEKYPTPPASTSQAAAVQAGKERFTAETGLQFPQAPANPVPVEKSSPSVSSPAPAPQDGQSPSDAEGSEPSP